MVKVKKVIKRRHDKEYVEYHLHVYIPKGFVEVCGSEFEIDVDHLSCEIRLKPRHESRGLLGDEHFFHQA